MGIYKGEKRSNIYLGVKRMQMIRKEDESRYKWEGEVVMEGNG